MLWLLFDKRNGRNPQNYKKRAEAIDLPKDIGTLINSGQWALEILSNQYHYSYVILKSYQVLEGKYWKIQY